MSTFKPLIAKVTAKAFVDAGGILEPGMKLEKDYISYFPTMTVLRYDEGYNIWWGNDTAKDYMLQLEHLFITINVLEFTPIKK